MKINSHTCPQCKAIIRVPAHVPIKDKLHVYFLDGKYYCSSTCKDIARGWRLKSKSKFNEVFDENEIELLYQLLKKRDDSILKSIVRIESKPIMTNKDDEKYCLLTGEHNIIESIISKMNSELL